MAIIEKIISSVDKDVDKLKLSYTAGENVKWCSSCGRQYDNYSKNLS